MTLNDLTCAIDEFDVPIEVTRHLPSPIVDGFVSSKNEDKIFSVCASVQPMTQKELERMPEGMRNSGAVKMYTECELKTVETSDCRIPDRFDYRGVTYQVQMVDDWYDLAGYYKIIATRMGT